MKRNILTLSAISPAVVAALTVIETMLRSTPKTATKKTMM